MADNGVVDINLAVQMEAWAGLLASLVSVGEVAGASVPAVKTLAAAANNINLNVNLTQLSSLTKLYSELGKAIGAAGDSSKSAAEFLDRFVKTLDILSKAEKKGTKVIGKETLSQFKDVTKELTKWVELVAKAREGVETLGAGVGTSVKNATKTPIKVEVDTTRPAKTKGRTNDRPPTNADALYSAYAEGALVNPAGKPIRGLVPVQGGVSADDLIKGHGLQKLDPMVKRPPLTTWQSYRLSQTLIAQRLKANPDLSPEDMNSMIQKYATELQDKKKTTSNRRLNRLEYEDFIASVAMLDPKFKNLPFPSRISNASPGQKASLTRGEVFQIMESLKPGFVSANMKESKRQATLDDYEMILAHMYPDRLPLNIPQSKLPLYQKDAGASHLPQPQTTLVKETVAPLDTPKEQPAKKRGRPSKKTVEAAAEIILEEAAPVSGAGNSSAFYKEVGAIIGNAFLATVQGKITTSSAKSETPGAAAERAEKQMAKAAAAKQKVDTSLLSGLMVVGPDGVTRKATKEEREEFLSGKPMKQGQVKAVNPPVPLLETELAKELGVRRTDITKVAKELGIQGEKVPYKIRGQQQYSTADAYRLIEYIASGGTLGPRRPGGGGPGNPPIDPFRGDYFWNQEPPDGRLPGRGPSEPIPHGGSWRRPHGGDTRSWSAFGGFGSQGYRVDAETRGQFEQMESGQRFARAFVAAGYRTMAYGTYGLGLYAINSEFSALVKNISDAEQKLISLKRVMNPITTDFNGMRQAMFQLAKETGRAFGEVGDTMFTFAKQGKSSADIKELTKQTLIMSNIGEMTPAEASKVLTTTLAQFNMDASQAVDVIDKMNNVSNKNAVSFQALAEAVAQTGSAFKTHGGSFDQLLAITAGMSKATQLTGPTMGRVFRQTFSHLYEPKFEAMLKENGIATRGPQGQRLGPYEIVSGLSNVWPGMSQGKKMEMAKASGDVRYSSYFISMMNMWPAISKAFADSKNAELSAYKENIEYMKSYEARLNQTKAAWAELSVAVGDSGLLNFLKYLADASKGIAQSGVTKGVGKALGSPAGINALGGAAAGIALIQSLGILDIPTDLALSSASTPEDAALISRMSTRMKLLNTIGVLNWRKAGGMTRVMQQQAAGEPVRGYMPIEAGGTARLGKELGTLIKSIGPEGAMIAAALAAIVAGLYMWKKEVNGISENWKEANESSKIIRFSAQGIADALDKYGDVTDLATSIQARKGLYSAYSDFIENLDKISQATDLPWWDELKGPASEFGQSYVKYAKDFIGIGPDNMGQLQVKNPETNKYISLGEYRELPKEQQRKIQQEMMKRMAYIELDTVRMAAKSSYAIRYARDNSIRDPEGINTKRYTTEEFKKKAQSNLDRMSDLNMNSLRAFQDQERFYTEWYQNARGKADAPNWPEKFRQYYIGKGGVFKEKVEREKAYADAMSRLEDKKSQYESENMRVARSAAEAGIDIETIVSRLTRETDSQGNVVAEDKALAQRIRDEIPEILKLAETSELYRVDVELLQKALKETTKQYEKQVEVLKQQESLLKYNTSLFGMKDDPSTIYRSLEITQGKVDSLYKRREGEDSINSSLKRAINDLVGEGGNLENPTSDSYIKKLENKTNQLEYAYANSLRDQSDSGKKASEDIKKDLDAAQSELNSLRDDYLTWTKELTESERRRNDIQNEINEARTTELGQVSDLLQIYLGIVGAAETLSEVMKGVFSDFHRFALNVISTQTSINKAGIQRYTYAGVTSPTSDFASKSDELYLQQMRDRASFTEQQLSYYLDMSQKSELARVELEAQMKAARPWVENSKSRAFLGFNNLMTFKGGGNFTDLFFTRDGERMTQYDVIGNLNRMGRAMVQGSDVSGTARYGFRANMFAELDPKIGYKGMIDELWKRYVRYYNFSAQAGVPIRTGSIPMGIAGYEAMKNEMFTPDAMSGLMQEYAKQNPSPIGGSKKDINDWYKKYFDYLSFKIADQFEVMTGGLEKKGIFKQIDQQLQDLAQDPALVFERNWTDAMKKLAQNAQYYMQGVNKWQSQMIKAQIETDFAELIVETRRYITDTQRAMEKLYISRYVTRGFEQYIGGVKGRLGTTPGMAGYEGYISPMAKDVTDAISQKGGAYKDLVSSMYFTRKKGLENVQRAAYAGVDVTDYLRQLYTDLERQKAVGLELLRQIQEDMQKEIILGYAASLENAIISIQTSIRDVAATSGMVNLDSVIAAARGGNMEGMPTSADTIQSVVGKGLQDAVNRYGEALRNIAEIEDRISKTTSDQVKYRQDLNKELIWYKGELNKISQVIADMAAAELFASKQKQLFGAIGAVNQFAISVDQNRRAQSMLNPYLMAGQSGAGITSMSSGYISVAERSLSQSQDTLNTIMRLMEEITSGRIGYEDAAKIAAKILPSMGVTPGANTLDALTKALSQALVDVNNKQLDVSMSTTSNRILSSFADLLVSGQAGGVPGLTKLSGFYESGARERATSILSYGSSSLKSSLLRMLTGESLSYASMGLSSRDAALLKQYDEFKTKGKMASDIERFAEASINAPSMINGRMLSQREIMAMSGASLSVEGATTEERLIDSLDSLRQTVGDLINTIIGNDASVSGPVGIGQQAIPNAITPVIPGISPTNPDFLPDITSPNYVPNGNPLAAPGLPDYKQSIMDLSENIKVHFPELTKAMNQLEQTIKTNNTTVSPLNRATGLWDPQMTFLKESARQNAENQHAIWKNGMAASEVKPVDKGESSNTQIRNF